jgi:ribosome-associated protein
MACRGLRGRVELTCRPVGLERRVGVGLRLGGRLPRLRNAEIEIAGDVIRLGQLLKLSALADSGADARELLLAGGVTVNGAPEARRGRQLHRGDLVRVGDQTVRVA